MRRRRAALLLVGVGYALVAAATTPFTGAADVLTGLPLLVFVVAAVIRWPWRPVRMASLVGPGPRHPYLPWAIVAIALVGWETANYLLPGSRADHPTFSSMTDAVDRYYGLKAIVFFLWLSLGWMIVERGAATSGAPAVGSGSDLP